MMHGGSEDIPMTVEERSLPATKGDIIRVQEEIREMARSITELTRSVAVLESRPQHVQPCRDYLSLKQQFEQFQASHSPCKELLSHLEMHKEMMADIRRNMIALITKAVGLAFGAYIGGWAVYGAVWILRELHGKGI